MMKTVLIIGSGISGLSAAISIAQGGGLAVLVSPCQSERAQSVMAEGGINAATVAPREDDSISLHSDETFMAGCEIADPKAIGLMCARAPEIILELENMGVVFSRDNHGHISTREFGGQSKARTVFSGASTGKQIVNALARRVRFYEAKGAIIRRLNTHFVSAIIENGICYGVLLYDEAEEVIVEAKADAVILATGGQNLLFGKTTGSTLCDGSAAAVVFTQGALLKNLEFIQYHPTTIETPNKRMLISEAARGEGGRLFYMDGNERIYFMEDKYGNRGNLMPRDVVSREMYMTGKDIYLDISFLGKDTINKRIPEIKERCADYIQLDVTKQPIPVAPSVHFFMGGLAVNSRHQTNIKGLYAVGECASMYHGANRLGGNSLLAAYYSGSTAAKDILDCADNVTIKDSIDFKFYRQRVEDKFLAKNRKESNFPAVYILNQISVIMKDSLGIVRERQRLEHGLSDIDYYLSAVDKLYFNPSLSKYRNYMVKYNLILAKAILMSALSRTESRGSHYRADYPERSAEFAVASFAAFNNGDITITHAKDSEGGEFLASNN